MSQEQVRAERESLEAFLAETLSPAERSRVFLPSFSQWGFSLAALAEISLALQAIGTDVRLGMWGSRTPIDDVGWSTPRWVAHLTLSHTRDEQLESALRRAGFSRDCFVKPPIRNWRPDERMDVPDRLARSSIRALTYRGSPMGRAILQLRPDHAVPVTDEYTWPRRWLERSMQSYAYVYDQVRHIVETTGITAVIVSNGRFLHDRAAAEAAGDAGAAVLYYDFGGKDTAFDLTRETTHDWAALQRRMLAMYKNWPEQERDALGERWFSGRRHHVDPANAHFTDAQVAGLGIDVDTTKRIVVFFSSSGDEFAELELDWAEYFGGQPQALMVLAEACREVEDTYLVVRSHPHKRRKAPDDVREWHAAVAAASPDLHLDEFSDVDSYALMEQADVVVTYGSTTGVEAAALGRAVLVLGPSAYDDLGCAVRPRDPDGLRRALQSAQPGDRSGALAFGLMMQRRGFALTHQSRDAEGHIVIRDTRIVDPPETARKIAHVLARTKRRWLSHGAWA